MSLILNVRCIPLAVYLSQKHMRPLNFKDELMTLHSSTPTLENIKYIENNRLVKWKKQQQKPNHYEQQATTPKPTTSTITRKTKTHKHHYQQQEAIVSGTPFNRSSCKEALCVMEQKHQKVRNVLFLFSLKCSTLISSRKYIKNVFNNTKHTKKRPNSDLDRCRHIGIPFWRNGLYYRSGKSHFLNKTNLLEDILRIWKYFF